MDKENQDVDHKQRFNELALFAGAGGGILGGHLLGWRTVCAVERDAYAAGILVQRQNDGILAPFPIWDDVCTFDGRPWRGIVDVVSGGFPCQDISAAGRGAGIDGAKSGLWVEMARIIREVRPRYVLVENSPMLTSRGLGRVLGDLASMGFDARWGVLGAIDVGAPHRRDRIWIVANARSGRRGESRGWQMEQQGRTEAERAGFVANTAGARLEGHGEIWQSQVSKSWSESALANTANERNVRRVGSVGAVEGSNDDQGSADDGRGEWWTVEPDVGRVAHGVAARVDRLKAIGNGQVPAVAALAWRLLGGE